MGRKVMCFNKIYPIFSCELEEDGVISRIFDVVDEVHLPIMLQDGGLNLQNVNKWLIQRRIPEKREGLEEARKRFKTFENYHNMLSLSDQYWFQFSKKEKWNKLNFFDNKYQNETGKIFLEPWDVNEDLVSKPNPDLSTNGVLRKRWVQQERKVSYLIKAGSERFNQNPISEILTTMFLEKLNIIPFVRYELVVDGLKMCSKCANFIDKDSEFVPVSQVYYNKPRDKQKETVYDHIVNQSVSFGLDRDYVTDYLDSMIAADLIINNNDRHLNNFGYIRDVNTGKLLRFAPLFDSGTAFRISNNVKARDMFKDRQNSALAKAFEKNDIEEVDVKRVQKAVALFPTLTRQEKLVVVERVYESANMINSEVRRSREKKKIIVRENKV